MFKKTITKRNLILIISLVLVLSLTLIMPVKSQDNYEGEAYKLNSLGLFLGSDKGFELDRTPTRIESAVMLIRLLGKEDEVKSNQYSHPFTDVPSWADQYVGYMYENGLTKGISTTEFGSTNLVSLNSYTTFLLRVLGYDDNKGDFSWNQAIDKGIEVGIVDESLVDSYIDEQYQFLRGDMVHLSFTSLSIPLKDREMTLTEKLIQENVLTLDKAKEVGLFVNINIPLTTESVAFLTFDPSTLPVELKEASLISFGATALDNVDEIYETNKGSNSIYNSASIGNNVVKLSTTVSGGDNAIISLYDENNKLISVTLVGSDQFLTSDHRYIYFEGEVYNGTRIEREDFIIERYVNGVLDTSYDGRVNFGTQYFEPEIILTDEEAIVNEIPGEFKCGPILLESHDVEYKLISLNEDLRNVVIKHY